jgi:hypothetical protein
VPILYETAQPFQGDAYAAYGAAQTQLQAAPEIARLKLQGASLRQQGASDAARLQAGLVAGDADRLQGGMESAARQQLANEAFVSSGTPTLRDQYELQGQMALQQDRARLQAEMMDLELTTQERMKLSRMKNAVGEIEGDPTLTDEEKADMVGQIKTGISRSEYREQRSRAKAEEQMIQAKVKDFEMQAALQENHLKAVSGGAEDKIVQVPDPQFAKEEALVVRDLNPEWTDDQVKAAVKEKAIRAGAYREFMPDSKGTLLPLDRGRGMSAGGTGGGRAATVASGGVSGQKGQLTMEQALPIVMKLVEGGHVKPDQVTATAVQVAKEMMAGQDAYTGEREGAGRDIKPAPFSLDKPSAAAPAQGARVAQYNDQMARIAANPALPPQKKDEANKLYWQRHKLFAKYSSADGQISPAVPDVRRKVAEIDAALNALEPAPPAAAPGPNVPAPGTFGGVATDPNTPRRESWIGREVVQPFEEIIGAVGRGDFMGTKR